MILTAMGLLIIFSFYVTQLTHSRGGRQAQIIRLLHLQTE